MSERKYTLANLVVRSGGKLKYIHDPTEEKWIHEIVVEDIHFSDPAWPYPICCIAGVRACPPSKTGGVDGWRVRRLNAMASLCAVRYGGQWKDYWKTAQ